MISGVQTKARDGIMTWRGWDDVKSPEKKLVEAQSCLACRWVDMDSLARDPPQYAKWRKESYSVRDAARVLMAAGGVGPDVQILKMRQESGKAGARSRRGQRRNNRRRDIEEDM